MTHGSRGARYPSLEGRTVLVTGGASGIGAALVESFYHQGARVAFLDVDTAAASVLRARFEPEPLFCECDLRDLDALAAAVQLVERRLGPIRALVNNAADDTRHEFSRVGPDDWQRILDTNLRHQFFASQQVAPGMAAAGGGAIVNMSSITWLLGQSEMPVYTTAKAAVVGMTKALARELGPQEIRVNCVLPGWIMTERQLTLWMTPEGEERLLAAQCLKRKLVPHEVEAMVLFLASDDASACTGQSFIVDGGWS